MVGHATRDAGAGLAPHVGARLSHWHRPLQRQSTEDDDGRHPSVDYHVLPGPSAGHHRGRRVDAVRELDRRADAPAQESPALFITPTDDNLEAFLSAAIINKQVPVAVVSKEELATLVLTVSPADSPPPSGAARFVRCIVGYCASPKDRGATSVQLTKGDTVVWSRTVKKGRGEKNRQSLAEAIAKQLKADYFPQEPISGIIRR